MKIVLYIAIALAVLSGAWFVFFRKTTQSTTESTSKQNNAATQDAGGSSDTTPPVLDNIKVVAASVPYAAPIHFSSLDAMIAAASADTKKKNNVVSVAPPNVSTLSSAAQEWLSALNYKTTNTGFAVIQIWTSKKQVTEKLRLEVDAYLKRCAAYDSTRITPNSFYVSESVFTFKGSHEARWELTIRETRKQTFLSDFEEWKKNTSKSGAVIISKR